jgi:hypothetical protein
MTPIFPKILMELKIMDSLRKIGVMIGQIGQRFSSCAGIPNSLNSLLGGRGYFYKGNWKLYFYFCEVHVNNP